MMRPINAQFLDRIIESWHEEVLKPLRFLSTDVNHDDFLYVERRAMAVKFGLDCVGFILRSQYKITRESDVDDYFCAFQDFLNYYGREVLVPLQLVTSDYGVMALDHPFYEQRRKFISRIVDEFLEKHEP